MRRVADGGDVGEKSVLVVSLKNSGIWLYSNDTFSLP